MLGILDNIRYENINISEEGNFVKQVKLLYNELDDNLINTFKENYKNIRNIEDNIKLIFCCSEQIEISNYNDFKQLIENRNYFEVFDDCEDDKITLKIEINKIIYNNTYNIYDSQEFNRWITNKKYTNFINYIQENFDINKKIIFNYVNEQKLNIDFNLIAFVSQDNYQENIKTPIDYDRQEILNNMTDICNTNINNLQLIPTDFYCSNTDFKDDILYQYMSKVCLFLSAIFIADISIYKNDYLKLIIKGYKTKTINLHDDNIPYDKNTFYKTFQFIYDSNSLYTRVLLARNIIAENITDDNFNIFYINKNILDIMISNYNLHLKDNMQKYLDYKIDITNIIQQNCENISKLVSNLLSDFFKLILFYLSFYITNILTNNAFLPRWLYLSLSLFFLAMTLSHNIWQYKNYISAIYRNSDYYSDILNNEEYKTLIDKNILIKNIKKFFKIANIILVLMFIFFIIVSSVFL